MRKKNKALKNKSRNSAVEYIERKTGLIRQEQIPGEAWIKWLYNYPLGNLTLETIVKRRFFSSLYGKLMDKKKSAGKIDSFIDMFNIDLSEYQRNKDDYQTFNDFFIRKLKPGTRLINQNRSSVVSPADGKIFIYYRMKGDDVFYVKGYQFSLYNLIKNKKIAKRFENSTIMIIRLGPADYHRFHFPADGVPEKVKSIRGSYYSVSPISLRRKRALCKNKRVYTVYHNTVFGEMIIVEVGATLVGSIKQTYTPFREYKKGEEKGYFSFGASTIVLVFKDKTVSIDNDLMLNSQLGYETSIKMGEQIALIGTYSSK